MEFHKILRTSPWLLRDLVDLGQVQSALGLASTAPCPVRTILLSELNRMAAAGSLSSVSLSEVTVASGLWGVRWDRGPGCGSSLVCKCYFFRIMECGLPFVFLLWAL